MKIENLFRYPALAVGLKPSASQGEARLRGLYRIIYSKTTRKGMQGLPKKPTPVSNSLLPQGKQGETGCPEAQNKRRNTGLPKKPTLQKPMSAGRPRSVANSAACEPEIETSRKHLTTLENRVTL